MSIKNFAELIEQSSHRGERKRVAVVGAEDSHALEAVLLAQKNNIVTPILVGNRKAIIQCLEELDHSPQEVVIIDSVGPEESAQIAAQLINSEQADFIMKGKIGTPQLMKVMLQKENHLRTDRVMSHIAFVEVPTYHKLFAVSDVALNPYPSLEHKKQIIENAVAAMKKMGIVMPKVAVMSSAEDINPRVPESVEASKLKEMWQAGQIADCIIEGPISYDLAVSKEACEIKNYCSPVAGDVDLMIVPNITAGNLLAKALMYSAGFKSAGFVVGAKIPIALSSRSATAEEKYMALVLAASAC